LLLRIGAAQQGVSEVQKQMVADEIMQFQQRQIAREVRPGYFCDERSLFMFGRARLRRSPSAKSELNASDGSVRITLPLTHSALTVVARLHPNSGP